MDFVLNNHGLCAKQSWTLPQNIRMKLSWSRRHRSLRPSPPGNCNTRQNHFEFSIESAERTENCPWKMMIFYWKMGRLFWKSRYTGKFWSNLTSFALADGDFNTKSDQIFTKNDTFCIENDELCIENDESCIDSNDGRAGPTVCQRWVKTKDFEFKTSNFVFKTRDFVLKPRDFVSNQGTLH